MIFPVTLPSLSSIDWLDQLIELYLNSPVYSLIALPLAVIFLFVLLKLLVKVKRLIPVKVTCWFCQLPHQVSFANQNSWTCPGCLQYNGFDADGGYNKPIAAQFECPTNCRRFCRPTNGCSASTNGLCEECNLNQQVKMRLVSNFVPFNDANFEEEFAQYKKHLENTYKLCHPCQVNVKKIIQAQDNKIQQSFGTKIVPESSKKSETLDGSNVFLSSQKDSRQSKGYRVAINLLESIAILSAVVLFMVGLNELQTFSDVILIDLPEEVRSVLNTIPQTIPATLGFLLSLIITLLNGKEQFNSLVALCLLLWLTAVPIQILVDDFINANDIFTLRPVLALFLIVFSTFKVAVYNFVKPTFNLKKPKFKVNQQDNSPTRINRLFVTEKIQEKFIEKLDKRHDFEGNTIDEKIKTLCIMDDKRNQFQDDNTSDTSSTDSVGRRNDIFKKIVLPAKFNYNSVSQSSWVFASNLSEGYSRNLKDEQDFDKSFFGYQRFASASWISQNNSGFMTPPPSLPGSFNDDCVTKRVSLKSTLSWPPVLDRQHCSLSSDSSSERSFNSIPTNLEPITTESSSFKSESLKLIQKLMLAIFVLLVFSFIILLSLPIKFNNCDINNCKFHITIEDAPRNNYC